MVSKKKASLQPLQSETARWSPPKGVSPGKKFELTDYFHDYIENNAPLETLGGISDKKCNKKESITQNNYFQEK